MRTKVRDNIELDLLCRNQPESAPVMQEIYELVERAVDRCRNAGNVVVQIVLKHS